MLRLAFLVLMVPAALHAQAPVPDTLTTAERATLVRQLEAERDRVHAAFGAVDAAQWSFRPAPGRWTVGEVAEHIGVTERTVLGLVRGPLQATPAVARDAAARGATDSLVVRAMANRGAKAQAPEMLRPTGRWANPAAMLAAFDSSRAATIAYVRDTRDPLRAHLVPHPALGPIDGYEWLLFLVAHGDRHLAQAAEVEADAAYPRAAR